MRKSYLLLLAIIPLFSSCNKNSGFPNPFPNDKYNKIGFKVDESTEKITRSLTSSEINLVIDTISDTHKAQNDAKVKCNEKATRETRDYTRAFAGEFKQGYNVSNVMKSETFTTNVQAEGEGEKSKTARLKTTNTIEMTSQYSYGEIKENVVQDDYYYYCNEGDTPAESSNISSSYSVNLRSKKVTEGYTKTSDSLKITKEKPGDTSFKDDADLFYTKLHQSNYIFAPDSKCGADDKNDIVLVSATQTKHVDKITKKEGIFSLEDGRKYQAMDNTLTVTKLTPQDNKTWALATYVRVYKETVITSEVIQPNVQVKKLSNPITISYSEEINHFTTTYGEIGEDLPVIG